MVVAVAVQMAVNGLGCHVAAFSNIARIENTIRDYVEQAVHHMFAAGGTNSKQTCITFSLLRGMALAQLNLIYPMLGSEEATLVLWS